MLWIYALVLLLSPVLYYCLKVLRWLYIVQVTIRNSHKPFLVEKPHWLFGHMYIHGNFTEEGLMDNLEWMKRSKNGVYTYFLPVGQSLAFSHPDSLKKIIKSAEPKGFIPAVGRSYMLLLPWLGEGLLTSSGRKWQRNRRLLTPAFHFDVLKPYVRIYSDCTDHLIRQIKLASSAGQSVEIFRPITLCTLSVILKCAFSVEENVQELGDKSPYVKTVHGLGKLFTERLFHPHWFIDSIYKLSQHGKEFFRLCETSHSYAEDVIRKRKESLRNGEDPTKLKRYIDFLDILLLAKDENGNGLTDQEIRDEVETFMFEAHDTTSCGLSWLLYNLAKHRDIQTKVQSEIDTVMAGREDASEITWDDLNSIPYLTRCIKESLRTHPPVPIVNREISKPLEVDGHEIPAGSIVEICIFNVHHNPLVWGDDCMKYDPDRFLPERMENMDPYAYIPFSAGPRNCIGQVFAMNEMKTVTLKILQKFDLFLDETHKVRMKPDLVLRAENGIKLFFRPRVKDGRH